MDQRNKRDRGPRGSRNGRAKLTEAIVVQLRQEYRGDSDQLSEWSQLYGMSRDSLIDALTSRTWRHVTPSTTPSTR